MQDGQEDELVFTVVEDKATPVSRIPIQDLGLTERAHLQEWVIAHPEIIGSGVLTIAFEFDRWTTSNGPAPRDRLDVLGLDRGGRLVVAELKRGQAPDTVEVQAIKYAAMVSRFTEEILADLYAEFVLKTQNVSLTITEASERLQSHADSGLSPDLLLQPRIVLLAEDFSATVTSSVVWLNEQGVDITLKRYQAYQTPLGETVVTVSQYYPVADVAAFEVGPRTRRASPSSRAELPEVPWSIEDLALLHSLPFEVPHAILELCSASPEEWIGSTDAYQRAAVEKKSGMGKLAGFGYAVRTRFGRSNPPWSTKWAEGGISQQYYSVSRDTADLLESDLISSNHSRELMRSPVAH
jgi:hypothetical protein